MSTTLQWFLIALVLIGSLSMLALTAPAGRRWKLLTLGLTAMVLPVSYMTANDLLSRPKPLQQELLQGRLNSAVVLSSLLKEGDDIYLWLQIEGVDEPRAYRLPWSEAVAVQLHKAEQEAEEQGIKTTLKLPDGEVPGNGVPMFEVAAPAALPAKVDE